jgi:hypothetical protein
VNANLCQYCLNRCDWNCLDRFELASVGRSGCTIILPLHMR